jgi:hypothetical protein
MFTRVKNVVSNSMFYRRWIVYKWFWLILAAGFLIWDPFGLCPYLSAGDIVTAMKSTT